MTRFPRLLGICTAVAVLVVGTLALAQARKAAPEERLKVLTKQVQWAAGQGNPGGFRMVQPMMPSVPGYYQLGMPNVQKELELVPEQVEKLKEIGKKYYEQMRADQNVWKDWQKMTPEERKAKSAQIQESYKKRAEAVKAEIEKVLLPHQIKLIKEIDFRTRAPYSLQNPWTLQQLGISDQQKEKLQKIRDKMTEQYQELQKKALEDAMNVLTPEQKEKLKEQIHTRGY